MDSPRAINVLIKYMFKNLNTFSDKRTFSVEMG